MSRDRQEAEPAQGDSGAPLALAPGRVGATRHAVELVSGRRLEIEEQAARETLIVRARTGECILTVQLTDAGPVLSFTGAAIEMASTGSLTLRCDQLNVQTGSAAIDIERDLVERVGGDAVRQAAGASVTTARSVAVTATPGGIALRANDDVDVKGERVRLNCDDPPMPLTWEEHKARQAILQADTDRRSGPHQLTDTSETRDRT